MPARPLKILLVENHPDTRTQLAGYLGGCGHEVHIAPDAPKARDVLSSTPVDILLCDIRLGKDDGWQLMTEINQGAVSFAIAMSGLGTTEDREKSRQAGFRHHLIKPFLPEELDKVLEEAALLLPHPEKSTRGETLVNDSVKTTKGISC